MIKALCFVFIYFDYIGEFSITNTDWSDAYIAEIFEL